MQKTKVKKSIITVIDTSPFSEWQVDRKPERPEMDLGVKYQEKV